MAETGHPAKRSTAEPQTDTGELNELCPQASRPQRQVAAVCEIHQTNRVNPCPKLYNTNQMRIEMKTKAGKYIIAVNTNHTITKSDHPLFGSIFPLFSSYHIIVNDVMQWYNIKHMKA